MRCAKRVRGFDLRLIGSDPAPSAEARRLGIEFVAMELRLAESDFVFVHSALTPETRGLIGEAQLCAMKLSAMLGRHDTRSRAARPDGEILTFRDQAKFMASSRPPEKLDDLQNDPFELHSLAGDPAHRATLERLRTQLHAWIAEDLKRNEAADKILRAEFGLGEYGVLLKVPQATANEP